MHPGLLANFGYRESLVTFERACIVFTFYLAVQFLNVT